MHAVGACAICCTSFFWEAVKHGGEEHGPWCQPDYSCVLELLLISCGVSRSYHFLSHPIRTINRGRCPWVVVRDVWVNVWNECLACNKHLVSLNPHAISSPAPSSLTSITDNIVPSPQYWTQLRPVLWLILDARILAEYFHFDWIMLYDECCEIITPVIELLYDSILADRRKCLPLALKTVLCCKRATWIWPKTSY